MLVPNNQPKRHASTLNFFHLVKEREEIIIERFGKYDRTQTSGLQFKWPFIEAARSVNWSKQKRDKDGNVFYVRDQSYRVDQRERVYDLPGQSVITKDNVAMKINALVYFIIQDPKKAVYGIDDLPLGIEKLAQTTLRNIIGSMHLDETLTSRDEINAQLCSTLDGATDKWGVAVTRVELQEVSPPREIEHAMEKQMTAERNKRAQITTAEAAKQSAILMAEGKRASRILEAEGERASRILDAEGRQKEQVLIAQGEAEAIAAVGKAQRKALEDIQAGIGAKGDPANFVLSKEYIAAFGQLTKSQDNKLVVVPTEISALAGLATSFLSSLKLNDRVQE
jgi:regulator of protease activity HflC (stomatin/prohibitin superfamily)